MCTLTTDLMDSGMQFQMTGPATEKALSTSLVLVLGTDLQCSFCCRKNVVADA